MQCTIEIFEKGQWQDCCTIQIENPARDGNSPSILQYKKEYAENPRHAQSPVSLLYPVRLEPCKLAHWPAFLLDFIPREAGREYLLEHLKLPDQSSSDWALLTAGAINPVGKLRIKEAVAFSNQNRLRLPPEAIHGFSLEDVLQRREPFLQYIQDDSILAAGATSIQGTSPKFFLTQGHDSRWYADGFLPDSGAAKHYIIKLSRARRLADWKILQNESAFMYVARDMGLSVSEDMPNCQEDMLFVPRFDRKVSSEGLIRYHQESLISLANLINAQELFTQNQALKILRACVTHPTETTLEFLKRDVLNLILGNTDNHPNNTSIQIINGEVRLTPLYDFAPMNLDSDEIERSMNWFGSTGKELTNWVDILDSLSLAPAEAAEIRREMLAFAQKIEPLESIMTKHQVDDDIIEARYYSIQSQILQLRELK